MPAYLRTLRPRKCTSVSTSPSTRRSDQLKLQPCQSTCPGAPELVTAGGSCLLSEPAFPPLVASSASATRPAKGKKPRTRTTGTQQWLRVMAISFHDWTSDELSDTSPMPETV